MERNLLLSFAGFYKIDICPPQFINNFFEGFYVNHLYKQYKSSIDLKRNQNLQYRKEIDGLRAIAVLPVIFFHSGLFGFTGGYVGVDIFFVISGYLIT